MKTGAGATVTVTLFELPYVGSLLVLPARDNVYVPGGRLVIVYALLASKLAFVRFDARTVLFPKIDTVSPVYKARFSVNLIVPLFTPEHDSPVAVAVCMLGVFNTGLSSMIKEVASPHELTERTLTVLFASTTLFAKSPLMSLPEKVSILPVYSDDGK